MEKNTNRLIDLTNQLLDFRKTEMDKFSLNFVKTDITELLEETYGVFKVAAEQKEIIFKLEVPGIALQAYVDPEAMKKILSNLFNNAIKYAETRVHVKLQNFNSEDTFFKIIFKNDGYIIPYDLKEKIFEPFYRINETEKQSGTWHRTPAFPFSGRITQRCTGPVKIGRWDEYLCSFATHSSGKGIPVTCG